MEEYASIEALTAPRLPEDDVPLPGVGKVRVRGMNRKETLATQKIDDVAERDAHIVAIGMLKPHMSVSQVKAWGAAATGGEIELVSRRIGELSGLIEGQAKEVYQEFEADPGSEFRALSDAETGLALGRANEAGAQ